MSLVLVDQKYVLGLKDHVDLKYLKYHVFEPIDTVSTV
jgi:hypothetical protein